MFGGKLLTNHIQPLDYKNCLLTVFSNQLYIFDLNQTQIVKKIQLSENLVKAWRFFQNQNKIVAMDETGSLIEVVCKQSKKGNEIWYDNVNISSKKIVKGFVCDARIVVKSEFQSAFTVYFIQENTLYEFQNGVKNVISKQVSKILFSSQSHIVCNMTGKQSQIRIISLGSQVQSKQLTYEHSVEITASVVFESHLIVGDIRGKIYLFRNYLQNEKGNQLLTTKYEWHVHQVNSLFLEQEYLYSCGQEGTVVMWHLRENKRDFLPRIGTQIQKIFVAQGIVYSLLKDNSITAIDLSNDKLLKHYRTVVNPFGFNTKGIRENSFEGKDITFLSSQANNRNLLLSSGLAGSLQLVNLNDGSNHQIQILPRNLISRLDQYYPEPHDIHDASFNKDWTLMCCSTYGINHNYLHFYKNQGYNLEYNLISKVQNPHEGKIKIISYNNTFITYAEEEKTLRFWSRVRKAKKSIIQKQEEYFTCSGQINYRQKSIKNCSVLTDQNLLLVNYADEIVLIDLQKRQIQMAFKGKGSIQKAFLVKKSKTSLNLFLVTPNKILTYQINRSDKTLKSGKNTYLFQKQQHKRTQFTVSSSGKVAFLVKYLTKQVVFQYDLNKSSISQSFENQNPSQVSILSICYHNGKLISFGSDSTFTNLTNAQQIVKLSSKSGLSVHGMETEQDSGMNLQNQSFENVHKNYIERQNVRKKAEIYQCIEKIQLEMYPSLGFSFNALCEKMFI